MNKLSIFRILAGVLLSIAFFAHITRAYVIDEVFGHQLHDAAKKGDVKRVEDLIEHNAIVNALNLLGATPLHYAARNGQVETLALLITNQANVHAENFITKITPLHEAAKLHKIPKKDIANYIKVATLLIANKANVNARDYKGRTPLHYAAARGNIEMVRLLIDSGANVNAEDARGQTPWDYARLNDHTSIMELLPPSEHAHNDAWVTSQHEKKISSRVEKIINSIFGDMNTAAASHCIYLNYRISPTVMPLPTEGELNAQQELAQSELTPMTIELNSSMTEIFGTEGTFRHATVIINRLLPSPSSEITNTPTYTSNIPSQHEDRALSIASIDSTNTDTNSIDIYTSSTIPDQQAYNTVIITRRTDLPNNEATTSSANINYVLSFLEDQTVEELVDFLFDDNTDIRVTRSSTHTSPSNTRFYGQASDTVIIRRIDTSINSIATIVPTNGDSTFHYTPEERILEELEDEESDNPPATSLNAQNEAIVTNQDTEMNELLGSLSTITIATHEVTNTSENNSTSVDDEEDSDTDKPLVRFLTL